MRKIVVFNRMSLDGYFSSENGDFDWFIADPQVDAAAHEMMKPDTVLFGRVTFDQFVEVWPALVNNPHVPEPAKRIARELTSMAKVVFSTTAQAPTWENTALYHGNLVDEVSALKHSEGEDITIFGSGTLVRQLAEADLIDEYIIGLTPVILGGGKYLFDQHTRRTLELKQARHFDSGNVLLHYAVVRT